MTKFILVRHGQTEWNRVERFRGRIDIPLNETGLAQAEAVGARLANSRIAAIFSSPLSRTMATAEPISRRTGVAVQRLDGLIDVDFGEWQGLSPNEVAERCPNEFALWSTKPKGLRFPGGESLEEVRLRAVSTVSDLVPRYDDSTVVLVSHNVVCRVLLLGLLGLDESHFWQIGQDNAAINAFVHDARRGFVVTLVNDTCHLELKGA